VLWIIEDTCFQIRSWVFSNLLDVIEATGEVALGKEVAIALSGYLYKNTVAELTQVDFLFRRSWK